MIENFKQNQIGLNWPGGKYDAHGNHLNSFLAPLNLLLCPFLPQPIEIGCILSMLLHLTYQKVMDRN